MQAKGPISTKSATESTYQYINKWWQFLYRLFKYTQATIGVVSPVLVGFVLILLAYALISMDQFTDLFIAMIYDWSTMWQSKDELALTNWHGYLEVFFRDLSFVGGLILWAFTLSFTSRWCLLRATIRPVLIQEQFSTLRKPIEHFQEKLLRYLPRFMGSLPFLIVTLTFLQTGLNIKDKPYGAFCWPTAIALIGWAVIQAFNSIHVTLVNQKVKDGASDYNEAVTSGTGVKPSSYPVFITWVRVITFINAFFIVLFSISFNLIEPSRWFGFGAITLSAFGSYSLLGMWVNFQLNRRYISLLGFLVCFSILLYVSGLDVLRREVRVVDTTPLKRVSDVTYVHNWLLDKVAKGGTTDTIPVFIVASEGGGSRSAYWTASTLSYLNDSIPGFSDHVLAISGVSGGSVGAGFYTAWLHDHPASRSIRPTMDSIITGDFLSALTGAFCYTDPTLGGLTFWTAKFDRARWLEDSFRNRFARFSTTKPFTLDSGLASLYKDQIRLPLLLLNSTIVETGQKAVISPVSLDTTNFYHTRDVLADLKQDIPVKSAMALSARFPVVTPAGLICTNSMSYRLVDGGYYENTGLQTAYQMVQLLNKCLKQDSALRKITRPVKPVIIFIQNGKESLNAALKYTKGFAPLTAFFNAWGDRTPATVGDLQYFIASSVQADEFLRITLARSNEEVIPLGWYLSKTASKIMFAQTDKMSKQSNTKPLDENVKSFARIKRLVQ
ncbi:patatin-like phospholipase family protein [Spirosoma sp.]|uniref:patatin-like phospholipase family protein n=1 Tax=Spirosoma sp. TaxID=1899569 RepID=UPI002613851B|nr:patatin-like phospholipase family protein [Spirosoma sp.]MCX6218005.1 patatin-like phospholipase family protein [Spirosoma sp.]